MRSGIPPSKACQMALDPIQKFYPGTKGSKLHSNVCNTSGALVCVNKNGEFGGANINWSPFPFSVQNASMAEPQVFSAP
jgi:hypothetical protein